jgi:hypothetical protein
MNLTETQISEFFNSKENESSTDTEIHKNSRNKGKFHQRQPYGSQIMKGRKQAMEDISNHCKNYVRTEYKVLAFCQNKEQIISINTCIL